jgi:hypothetical protein
VIGRAKPVVALLARFVFLSSCFLKCAATWPELAGVFESTPVYGHAGRLSRAQVVVALSTGVREDDLFMYCAASSNAE